MSSIDIYSTEKFKPTFLYIKQHTITGKLYLGKTTKNPEKYLGSGSYWIKHIAKHGKEHVVNLWYCLFYDKDECKKLALLLSDICNVVDDKSWANQLPEQVENNNNTEGFAVAKDSVTGKCIGLVRITDVRWNTGEICSINKGRKQQKKRINMPPPWNAGLTKNDPRVAAYGMKGSIARKGTTQSETTRQKNSNSNSGEKHWHFGGKNSEETRRKISIGNAGNIQTKDSNEKRSKKMKGIPKPKIVTRIFDRKEMDIANFCQWMKCNPFSK